MSAAVTLLRLHVGAPLYAPLNKEGRGALSNCTKAVANSGRASARSPKGIVVHSSSKLCSMQRNNAFENTCS